MQLASSARVATQVRLITIGMLLVLSLIPLARSENTSRIYVYAGFGTDARSWLPIWCDGIIVAKLKHGTFFAINVEPGRHLIAVAKGLPVSVEVGPSEDSFVSLGWPRSRGARPIATFSVVRPAHGRKELVALRYINSDKALSSSVPKSDPRDPPRLKTRPAKEATR